ncbi:MAG: hypothetical protein K2N80_03160 [Lachnospiraceae bacterium]|nr:hypothetical protein [Lachnospiraceae bacterium]
MRNEGWEKQQMRRASYRAALRSDAGEEQIGRAFAECQCILEQEKEAHRLLTASLYRYGGFLFLYTEGIGETAVPEKLFAPAAPFLQKWPAVIETPDEDRAWAFMQPYYYHALPETAEEWMQNRQPSLRRGRIALLAPGKWENYMTHHLALMREGLIEGDRYHLISIHENVLFSYFEEPKTMTNLQKKPGAQSKALEDWLLTDPESHFMRFVLGQGPGPDENFVFLPCVAGV